MSVFYKNHINIASWNIQGMTEDKLRDEMVRDFITNNDCAIFVESWLNDNIAVDNNYTYCLLAKKSSRGRSKGGIIVTMKKEMKKGIKILQTFESHILWLKFEKSCFKLSSDLYVCVVYVPPIDTIKQGCDKYYIWEVIEDHILSYSNYGDVLIIGDLNSRTGAENDLLEPNVHIDSMHCLDGGDKVNVRISNDSVLSQYGKTVIDLCKHNNLLILNGRTLGDLDGKYTSFHYNGCSVIDYCIVSHNILPSVMYFKVSEPTHISDHANISVCLKGIIKNNTHEKTIPNNCKLFPPGYVWDEKRYLEALNTEKITKMTESVKSNNMYSNDSAGINKMCDDITNILSETASFSLLHKKMYKSKCRKAKTAKWYTNDIHKLKCNVIHTAKLLKKYPNDSIVRGNYVRHKKLYKQVCRQAKRRYISRLAQELNESEL